ncbi:unnamed protein product [Lepeophtheirus salmonis]|uniref:(salmon louse) hypothetical protein n=1 Tax=Lepeophtheirus salmonis TaxID=72036 RepID=A0A7R8CUX7_LEPSM|nr:unnamed protein product [Lepeophtheirus salmonis]CAF2938796.1 unnamed protein product [Lepeophtheirus salmonis]
MLLLEMTLGQYSGLSPTKLFRNIAPILTGVGFAIVSSLIIQTLDDLAIIMWSSQGLYNLFSNRRLSGEDSFLIKMYSMVTRTMILGIWECLMDSQFFALESFVLLSFLFIALSTKSLGKVSILIVVLCYGLLVTLTIRGFMANGAWTGVYKLLTPRWEYLNKPWHVRCSFKPTDLWYENEHKELMVLDASPKGSPLMAFKRGYKGGGNITEV